MSNIVFKRRALGFTEYIKPYKMSEKESGFGKTLLMDKGLIPPGLSIEEWLRIIKDNGVVFYDSELMFSVPGRCTPEWIDFFPHSDGMKAGAVIVDIREDMAFYQMLRNFKLTDEANYLNAR